MPYLKKNEINTVVKPPLLMNSKIVAAKTLPIRIATGTKTILKTILSAGAFPKSTTIDAWRE